MGYKVEDCKGSPSEIEETSQFLASFFADGEGGGGGAPECGIPDAWCRRLRWWWDENPFCRRGSPRGLTLRDTSGKIVGFNGFIPHDYVVSDEVVPTLITTTFAVRESNRDAALSLFIRSHRQYRDYQFVDGWPNKKIDELLIRTGYTLQEDAKMLIYPVKRSAWKIRSWPFRVARLLCGTSNGPPGPGKIVTDLYDVADIPRISDSKLRKRVTKESLAWYLKSGSSPKYFLGWCDDDGLLQSYMIGQVRRKFGLNTMFVVDYAFLSCGQESALDWVVSTAAGRPDDFNIPGGVDVVIWPASGKHLSSPSSFKRALDPRVFYRVPERWRGLNRISQPFEGDYALL